MKAARSNRQEKADPERKLRSLGLVFVLIVGCACTLIFSYVELVNQETEHSSPTGTNDSAAAAVYR